MKTAEQWIALIGNRVNRTEFAQSPSAMVEFVSEIQKDVLQDCDHSRQLERELNAMTEVAEDLVNALNINDGVHASAYWRRIKEEALSRFTALKQAQEKKV